MKTLKYFAVLAAALALAPLIAQAEIAYTAKDVHMRAGPARDYPVVAIIAAGSEIFVEGCLSDYSWCDVVAGANRGWVYAGNISYPYQGDSVPLLTYGNTIGIGIVTFSLGAYWDYYYRGRPWYPQRRQWLDRPRPPVVRGDVHRPGPPASGSRPPSTRPPQGHGSGPDRGQPSPRPPVSRPTRQTRHSHHLRIRRAVRGRRRIVRRAEGHVRRVTTSPVATRIPQHAGGWRPSGYAPSGRALIAPARGLAAAGP